MSIQPNRPPRLPLPAETLVVGQDGDVLLSIAGILVLPIGSRIELGPDSPDGSVVGIRLASVDTGSPTVVLEVDTGGSSFVAAALEEVATEASVVEAAELITSTPADGSPVTAPDAPPPGASPLARATTGDNHSHPTLDRSK